DQFSISGMAGKFVLKQAVEDLLPNSIVYRRKMGFPTPWEYWLVGPQLEEVERLLLEPRSIERGFFRVEPLKRIFAEHRRKFRHQGNRIWRLVNCESWQRVTIDGEGADEIAQQLGSPAVVVQL